MPGVHGALPPSLHPPHGILAVGGCRKVPRDLVCSRLVPCALGYGGSGIGRWGPASFVVRRLWIRRPGARQPPRSLWADRSPVPWGRLCLSASMALRVSARAAGLRSWGPLCGWTGPFVSSSLSWVGGPRGLGGVALGLPLWPVRRYSVPPQRRLHAQPVCCRPSVGGWGAPGR